MSNATSGLLVGGIIPALLFGLFAVLTKASSQQGLQTSPYLIAVGLAIAAVGVLSGPLLGGLGPLSGKSVGLGFAAGLFWGLGMLLVSIALVKLAAPISQLVPLYNMNTLVAVLIGLWAFAEWRDLQLGWLLGGTVLITVGGLMVSRA